MLNSQQHEIFGVFGGRADKIPIFKKWVLKTTEHRSQCRGRQDLMFRGRNSIYVLYETFYIIWSASFSLLLFPHLFPDSVIVVLSVFHKC